MVYTYMRRILYQYTYVLKLTFSSPPPFKISEGTGLCTQMICTDTYSVYSHVFACSVDLDMNVYNHINDLLVNGFR